MNHPGNKAHPGQLAPHHSHRRGFTAVEVAMVATVIAIIALLALPIFRSRVESAREAAVLDELSSLAKVQLLVEADVNYYARLQDLDNGQNIDLNGPGIQNSPARAVPIAGWNGTLNTGTGAPTRGVWINNWQGPYLGAASGGRSNSVRRTASVGELQNYWFNGPLGDAGFIWVVGQNGMPSYSDPNFGTVNDNFNDDRYPIDPWGQPYIFFGPGTYGPNNFPGGFTESTYQSSLLVSLGPDGVPGTAIGPFTEPQAYFRSALESTEGLPDVDDFLYRF